eukprot:8729312-Ditylum_brightwellii.AAC.1
MGEEDALPTYHASKRRTNPQRQFTTTVSPSEVNLQEPPMAQSRGKSIHPWGLALDYPGTACLSRWLQQGIEVSCGPRWSRSAVMLAIEKGPHISAMTPDAMKLRHEDVQYQVEAGLYEVCTWEELQQKWPENLKVSPVAVIPQTERRGRIILDLLFPVFHQAKGKGGNHSRQHYSHQ